MVSSSVKVITGLKQGDTLSLMLHNLILEKGSREMNVNDGIV